MLLFNNQYKLCDQPYNVKCSLTETTKEVLPDESNLRCEKNDSEIKFIYLKIALFTALDSTASESDLSTTDGKFTVTSSNDETLSTGIITSSDPITGKIDLENVFKCINEKS